MLDFFSSIPTTKVKKRDYFVPPPTPETGWRPPTHFPNLAAAKFISIDTETKDPYLTKGAHGPAKGPGWGRKAGHIVGASIAVEAANGERGKWYFPVRHEVEPEYNLDPNSVFSFLRDTLKDNRPKIGANMMYDIGWLGEEGVRVNGPIYDIQFAEPILDEDAETNLDALAYKYLRDHKDSAQMYLWQAQAYGGAAGPKQRANIYRTSPRLVGHYGEADADLPIDILRAQWTQLQAEGLLEIFRLECGLIPLLIAMRRRGVRIDLDAAEKLKGVLAVAGQDALDGLRSIVGRDINPNSAEDLARAFTAAGIPFDRTGATERNPYGNPSFTKPFLETIDHPLARGVLECRKFEKLKNTFVQSYLLESNVDGRVHCQFHPLRGEDSNGQRKGAGTGRFASDCPNLQNIPVRTKEGKLIRAAFIPDEGALCWEKDDYSQVEYRFNVHYAVGPGSDEARALYANNPKTDYHIMTQDLVQHYAGIHIERKPIKNINFGLLYGMGEPKLARQIALDSKTIDEKQAKTIFNAYHTGNPYIKPSMKAAEDEAQANGYIRTIIGRKRRFVLWEPIEVNYQRRARPLPYAEAIRQYGPRIKRAETHKAINSKLQGSAADAIKVGMSKCWYDGIFAVTGVPHLQVHDELDFSVMDDTPEMREAFAEMRNILANALTMCGIVLRVPLIVDSGRGPNWGSID